MTGLSKQDYYEILDATLTEFVDKSGVEVDAELEEILLRFNRVLTTALGLSH